MKPPRNKRKFSRDLSFCVTCQVFYYRVAALMVVKGKKKPKKHPNHMIYTYLHTFNIRKHFISTRHQNSQLHTTKGNADKSHKLFSPFRVSICIFFVMEERRKLISTFNILHVLESNKPHALVFKPNC